MAFFVFFCFVQPFCIPLFPHAPKNLQKRYKILTRYKFHSGEEGGGGGVDCFFLSPNKNAKGSQN